MSHTKYALYAGERDGETLVEMLRPGQPVKAQGATAGVRDFIKTLCPDPKYTYAMVNAMGYSEFFGSNSNTDWYGHNPHLDFNGLLHAPEGIGADVEKDQMQGKDWPYGYPTFYGATAYAHHKNTDPQQLGFGDVIYAGINPKMKRVELVMRVFNEEAIKKGHQSILDRLRAGERVDVSMGCKIPFDLCSICTDWDTVKAAWKTYDPKLHKHPGVAILHYHKTRGPIRGLAVTKDDYCRCMREMKGKILLDGRKVFVYNDFCRFFDISFVWIGADRTARVMWHLMPDTLPKVTGPIAAAPVDPKTKLLELLAKLLASKTASRKLSEIEKEIPGGVAQAVLAAADQEPDISLDALMPMSARVGAKEMLSSLAALGIVLKPDEFTAVVTPHDRAVADHVMARGALPRFSTAGAGVDDTFAADPRCCLPEIMSACAPLASARSSFAPFLGPRVTRISIMKVASAPVVVDDSALSQKLAAQYNGYRLSVLENAESLFESGGASLFGPEKTANEGLGLLLLGLAPMIHMLSAHLREKAQAGTELGAVSNFVAENPSFTTVSTIGAGLRAAMGIQRAGGILPAAKTLFTAAKAML